MIRGGVIPQPRPRPRLVCTIVGSPDTTDRKVTRDPRSVVTIVRPSR